mmetsp:Transcript_1789/g.2746  ORF Transcript_1789/g.2746 Transcript_1789/m.2746 type:complete len:247 (-) Transcript_1789:409-1149(-)
MAILYQFRGHNLLCTPVRLDVVVEQRLRELWIVALVVAEAPVAHDIDDHVIAPLLPVFCGHLEGADHGHRIVSVAVEDGDVEGLAQVRAVESGARALRVRREANLVIHDDMDGAADIKVLNLCQLHGLVDNSLASKRGVSVQNDRHDTLLRLRRIAKVVLLGTNAAQGDRADCLQMRGIRLKRQGHGPEVRVDLNVRSAQVVLHVAGRRPILSRKFLKLCVHIIGRAHEFRNHFCHGLAKHVHENV